MTTSLLAERDSDVVITYQRTLTDTDTGGGTSTVTEPSVAARGNEILVTGNWFSSFSTDGGSTFTYVNPYTTFPPASEGQFCCDQVALYVPEPHDLMLWLLQYRSNASGNTLRLAVAHGDDIAQQTWRYYDFKSQDVGDWEGEWFDYPNLAVSDQFLYISSNMFQTTGAESFTRSMMLRVPLEKLETYANFDYDVFDTTEVGGLRATRGATDTMYWAGHLDRITLRVFTWENTSADIQTNDVEVDLWQVSNYSAPGPRGRNWLGRADWRVNAAWLSGETIGFAWTAPQDDNFRFPHIRVAILNRHTKKRLEQPHIWSKDVAFAYAEAAPNSEGRVAITLLYGGNLLYPGHAVGIYHPGAGEGPGKWDLVAAKGGTHGPFDNTCGDYLAIRRHGADPTTWVATGFTLEGGEDRTDVEVEIIRFRAE